MYISTFGARFYGGQIDRIDQGFSELGHLVNSDNSPSLIYSNDMAHCDAALQLWTANKEAKLIFNVLDCPSFVPEWPFIKNEWYHILRLANKVTCISQTVQTDIKEYFNIDADVIYNPIKPVSLLPNIDRDILCIFVGRCNASNKRVRELLWPLYKSLVPYFGEDCMHFVGSENSGFGVNHGVVSDNELNELYNRSVYGLISSKQEGLNLPLIEMICTGVKPVICNDMSTAKEFGDPKFFCEPTPKAMFNKMREIGQNMTECELILNKYRLQYSLQFSPVQIAQNILNVYPTVL